jgi:FAD/FMN-containing dehydrogenase
VSADLVARLRDVVGPDGVLDDPAGMSGHLTDWRNAYSGTAAAVVRPGSTEEVAAVVRLCREAGVALVPQGATPASAAAPCPMPRARRSCCP